MGDELIQLFQGMKKNGAMGFLCSAVALNSWVQLGRRSAMMRRERRRRLISHR
jgi:hypothetical protein